MEADRSFDLFAGLDGYRRVNAELVAEVPDLQSAKVIVDVAAGTGLITREAVMSAPNAHVLAIEPDRRQIQKAIPYLGSCRGRVDFIQSRAEDLLPIMPESFADVVFFCNAIHLLTEEEKVDCVQWIHRILRPGGYCVLNSAFAVESEPQHTRRYYYWWMRAAGKIRRRLGLKLSKEGPSQARKPVGREGYLGILGEAGFDPVVDELSEIAIPREGWEAICQYWLFLDGAMPGVDHLVANPILIMALQAAFPKWPTDTWPANWTRRWVQLVGRKK